jgi:hypothetical protein
MPCVTHDRDDFLLYRLREGDDLQVYRKVHLLRISFALGRVQYAAYRSQEHREADCLLGACHRRGARGRAYRRVCPTVLQLLQYVGRIVAVHGEVLIRLRTATTPNLFYDVVRIRGANHRDFRREPLLEGLRNEVPVCCEPPGHGRADVQTLCEGGTGRCELDVAFVDGNVLFRGRGEAHLRTMSASRFPSFLLTTELWSCRF